MRVAVLGAAGTIAPAIVRDLAASAEVDWMRLLDLDGDRAQQVAATQGAGKATAATVDAREPGALASLLAGVDVLVNTASYRVNLEAMRACLAAGCHYLDLGGLYWITRRQLELDAEFEHAGLLAVLGIGSSPGKTNVMARLGVVEVGDDVDSIAVAAAARDPLAADDGRLHPPYAIQTLIDELTMAPVVLRDGRPAKLEPMARGGVVDFGDPIGRAETIHTLHSELATFGESFGCRAASFRLSLSPALLAGLSRLTCAPAEDVAAAAREAVPASASTVSVHLVRVRGVQGSAVTVRAVTQPCFGFGGSVMSTAAPAAVAARLLARGVLTARGVLPPERCIEPAELFAELKARGCVVTVVRE